MGRRTIWVSAIGAVFIATAVAVGALAHGPGSTQKSGVAPARLSPSGSAAASSASSSSSRTEDLNVTITHGAPVVPVSMDTDLRDLPYVPATPLQRRAEAEPAIPVTPKQGPAPGPAPPIPASPLAMPATLVNFDGMTKNLNGAGWPPDTVGDVGASHYIQAVNTSFAVYNKSGTALLGPTTYNSFWATAGTGTACDTSHQGDPTVVYDPMNGRWIVGDFAFTGAGTTPPFYECIAVSKTADPVVGGWWMYAIRTDDAAHPWFADYPKMGIWPDGLYMTANMFDSTDVFREVRGWAFNRTDLESGAPVQTVIVDLNTTTYFSLLPSNMRHDSPPAGRENLFVSESQTLFAFHVFKFHVDYSGSGSTFTGPTNVSQTSYTVAPATVPSPANPLDSLRERLMMQNQYTNIGGAESLWVNHTVRTGASPAPTGIQWAQINVTGGTVVSPPVQQQIYGNVGSDGVHRWMGSLAVDKEGNMALGYSAASATLNPEIRYNGRLESDPLNTLPQGEAILAGNPSPVNGSQSGNCGGSSCVRWGDYSAMSLDPDGCTFWYTQEYYATNGLDWHTRVGAFRFDTAPSPDTCLPTTTAVSVARLTATRSKPGVAISWRTSSEAHTVGFSVWRAGKSGTWRRLNPALIPAKRVGQVTGSTYRYRDQTALPGQPYNYRLQIRERGGNRSWYGLAAVPAAR